MNIPVYRQRVGAQQAARSFVSCAASRSRVCVAASVCRLFVALILFTFAALPVSAQLVFESARVEIEGKFGEEQLHAAYPFVNRGSHSVTVREVTSGCGCTVPELEQKVYAPGEQGVLRAVFNVGQRQGEQRQTISVKTDAGDQILRLIVRLPVRLDMAPRILLFRSADTEPKTALLTFAEDSPVTVEAVTVSDPEAFTLVNTRWQEPAATEATPAKQQVFRIEVAGNKSGATETRAFVQIRSKGASGKVYTDYLHLRKIP